MGKPSGKVRVNVFERLSADDYEQVAFNHHKPSGLRSIVAIHSTTLGPALGGTRFYPYASEEAALTDVLRLAKGMTYKAAAAGLDLGGGKAVIIGEPARDRTEELVRAHGRFIDSLGGRYITAEDVGTTRADMDLIRRETRWVTGVSPSYGGSDDPSPATAYGLFHGLRAVAVELWGSDDLSERRFAVQGVGKVGIALVGHLVEAGAKVVAADVSQTALARAAERFGIETADESSVHAVECDVFLPCALGGILNDRTIPELRCAAVAGAANNQLLTPEHGKLVADAGILYAPDFVVNAGGVINVADELEGYDRDRARSKIEGIFTTLRQLFQIARSEKLTTAEVANRIAEERIRAVGRLKLVQTSPPRRLA
jgi:leucine dehydrogenase